MSTDFYLFIFRLHKQKSCQLVNKNILAGTMPRKRQGKASGEYGKAGETFHHYIAI
jgi:hypothetical protein